MKYFFIFLSFLTIFCETTRSQSGWKWQNSLPQGHTLTSVFFIDSLIGYAAGGGGSVIKTIDGGNNWTISTAQTTIPWFASLYFTDTNTGYAVGYDGKITKTINGGTTWFSLPSATNNYLQSVYFTSANVGYAVGDGGIIIKTNNAGVSWTTLTSGTSIPLWSVYFTNASTGYVAGYNGTILKTINNGNTWIAQTSGTNEWFNGIYFANDTIGYAVADGGVIVKTTNAGTTWDSLSSGTTQSIYSVFFTDANTGYITCGYGVGCKIFKTTNGGINWGAIMCGITEDMRSIYFVNASIGYAVGQYGKIFKTTNGGNNWIEKSSILTHDNLNSISLTSTNIGYTVGGFYHVDGIANNNHQTISKTSNSGISWVVQSNVFDDPLHSVCFTSNNVGYAVGDGGTILKTTNGGINWVLLGNGGTDLYSVYFVTVSTGYVVGFNSFHTGKILKTTDSGTSWTSLFPADQLSPRSVFFTDLNHGYIVGDNGRMLKTTNAGVTWTLMVSGTTKSLNSIYFTDANTGFAVGESGTILKTSNAGVNWSVISSGTIYWLYSLYFANATTGYAAGQNGCILKTTNAGNNWNLISSGTNYQLNSISFLDANIGYTVGDRGTILKTVTGGEYVNPNIDSLQILSLQDISTASKCNLPYNSKLFINTKLSGPAYYSGTILNYHIWFGDGSDTIFNKTATLVPSFIAANINHVYQASGIYSVICKVTAPDGRIDSLRINDLINISDTCASISGIVYNDANNNCIKDVGEIGISNHKVSIFQNGQFISLSYTDNNGLYAFNIPNISNYLIKVDTNSNTGYTSNCIGNISYYISEFPAMNRNFALHCGADFDIEGSLTGNDFHIGDTNNLILNIKNHSCISVDGNIILKLDSMVTFINSIPLPDLINGDSIIWNFNNLTSLSDVNIPISVLASSQVSDSSQYCFDVVALPDQGDSNPLNNVHQYCYPVTNIFNSIYKEVKSAIINNPDAELGTLEYTIHFQNTGFAVAQNISIIDTLDTNLDFSSFEILSSSHSMNLQIINNTNPAILKFIFSNIMLPDSISNEMLSHGYVTYTIKIKSNLSAGTTIKNTAYILFDNHPVITTNTTESTVPAAPVVLSPVIYCLNSTSQPLSATGSNLLWYVTLNSTGMISSPIPSTNQSGNTVYYVSQTVSGIEGPKAAITVTVLQPSTVFQNISICNGDSVLINGIWHSESGTFVDTLQNGFGCDSIIFSSITVLQSSNQNLQQAICEGQVYSIGIHNYTDSGIYTDTLQSGFGCDSIIVTDLTVYSLPNAYAGEDKNVCIGDTITLAAIGGVQYIWDNGITQGLSFIPALTTTYHVTVTDENNCSSLDSLVVTIKQNPTPIVTVFGAMNICQGDTVKLDAGAGFNEYLWSGNDTIQIINVTLQNNYSVAVIDSFGCTGTSDTIQITVFELPEIPMVTQAGDTLFSTIDIGNQWYYNNELIIGAIDQIYLPNQTGVYYVQVTDDNGCSSKSQSYNYVSSIDEISNNYFFAIYPNPVKDELTIELNQSGNKRIEFEIVNVLGQSIYGSFINNKKVVDMSDFSRGVYLIRMNTEKSIQYKKFIKQ